MCSNFEPIKANRAAWVKETFGCELPFEPWKPEAYPTDVAPFIYMDGGVLQCRLARFGMTPYWAPDKNKFGRKTYNARQETVKEKPTFRSAWKSSRFGFVLMDSFYEPNWETGKAVRWRIKRADGQPSLAASIWDSYTDNETGEIVRTFAMLTINADGHDVMKHFHKPQDEKRSIVILNDNDYASWLNTNNIKADEFLKLAPPGFLTSEPAPKNY